MSTITLRNIKKSYGDTEVIHGVDLDVSSGDFVVFVGPSGCGKSTLLRIIAGLEGVNSGTVEIDDELVNNVTASERGLAMVFQSYALYPHMSVYKNMAFGLENSKLPKAQIREKVEAAAQMLQITPYLERKPKALSGGQRQRVAIGRAIVRDPRAFLFDEPLSNLDAELRVTMRKELATLHNKIGGTMVYVTHDQTEAMTLADKIVVLQDGRVEQAGKPLELYNTPNNVFVAGFIGSPKMNLLPMNFKRQHGEASLRAGNCRIALPRNLPPSVQNLSDDAAVTVGIRPEHFSLATSSPPDMLATVDFTEQLGGATFLYCSADHLPQLTIHQVGQLPVDIGTEVPLTVDQSKLHLFDSTGQVLVNGFGDTA